MPPIKPEPGMTYDFEVERLFHIDGATVLAGCPSTSYEVLFPAVAEMYVDDKHYMTITIYGQEAFRFLQPNSDPRKAIKTQSVLDKEFLEGKKIVLHCTFKEKNDA